jgi:hypothetical protein
MYNSKELIGTTGHVTLYTKCRLNRCRYNRVRLQYEWGIVKKNIQVILHEGNGIQAE